MTATPSGRVVVAGEANGPVAHLRSPLSFWGGFEAESGRVIDVRHPDHGMVLSGTIVVMASGRGSSSASSVIAEAARLGTAPLAFIVGTADEVIATGAIVAAELYGMSLPVIEVEPPTLDACARADRITIQPSGALVIE